MEAYQSLSGYGLCCLPASSRLRLECVHALCDSRESALSLEAFLDVTRGRHRSSPIEAETIHPPCPQSLVTSRKAQ